MSFSIDEYLNSLGQVRRKNIEQVKVAIKYKGNASDIITLVNINGELHNKQEKPLIEKYTRQDYTRPTPPKPNQPQPVPIEEEGQCIEVPPLNHDKSTASKNRNIFQMFSSINLHQS